MKKLVVFPLCLSCVLAAVSAHATDLKQSKVTQVVNDVQIISAEDQKQKAASINDIFSMPDLLRTGAASRAELVAPDETVTRVGANTIFSFDPANRTIDLKQGSLLFHSPHGKGGGTIHTGSATASVLGSTLIVVTTPNGGFKVIALEDSVSVKLLNGLKQKLSPGQMAYILPGANQLSPVIIFRLDELTKMSLLVQGFNQPLPSLPLIQNQVNQQIKLISSGKMNDTGLYAGDTATPNQVEVLDVNTVTGDQQQQDQSKIVVSSAPPPPPPPTQLPPFDASAAEGADATINQSSLTDPSIPTPPNHVYTGTPLTIAGNSFFTGKSFDGFIANNIFVNTLGSDQLAVNLTPYTSLNTFDFVALNNIELDGSVTFKGLAPAENLALIAGNQILFTPGISVEANVNDFLLSSPNDMNFDDVGLFNLSKDINVNSFGNISFLDNSQVSATGTFIVSANGDFTFNDSQMSVDSASISSLNGNIFFNGSEVDTAGHITMFAPVSMNLNASTINSDFVTLNGTANTSINLNNTTVNAPSEILASTTGNIVVTGTSQEPETQPAVGHVVPSTRSFLNSDAGSGAVTLTSSAGSVSVTGTSISAHFLTLNSGDGILLDASGQTLAASGNGSTATFTAPNLVRINNADFSSYAILNIAANTIVLANDILAPISNFGCLTGQANFGNTMVPGDVNFINDIWQGQPVTAQTITLSSRPGSSLGVYVYPK